MNQIHALIGLACLLLLTTTAFGQSKLEAKQSKQIDQLFKDYNSLDQPGISVAVVKDGKLAYSNVFGAANLEHQTPITKATKFHVSSIGNQFIAFAILLLQEEGKLSLKDDIRKYLPTFPKFDQPITIENCLTHTDGLPDFYMLQGLGAWRLNDFRTSEQVTNYLSQLKKPVSPIGSPTNHYSTAGFVIAAEIVEKVSKQDFDQFAQKHIFEPLQMKNTMFQGNPAKLIPNKASAYNGMEGNYQNENIHHYSVAELNLYTSAEDLALWAMHLKDKKLIKATVVDQLDQKISYTNGEQGNAALGQYWGEYKGLEKVYHNAMGYGRLAYIARYPEQNFAIAILSNYYQRNVETIAEAITDLLLADQLKMEVKSEATATIVNEPVKKFVKLPKAKLERLCGSYWNAEGAYARQIILVNDTLRYSRGGDNQTPLLAIDENTFAMLGNLSVEVKFSEEGKKRLMAVHVDEDYVYNHESFEPKTYNTKDLEGFTGDFYCKELDTVYEIKLEKEQLVATNLRVATIPLNAMKTDLFTGENRFLSSVEFVRNADKNVIGFVVPLDGSELWFEKLELKGRN